VEHVTEKLPFRLSFDEIEKRFGVGTRVYWHFLTFIIVTNALLAIVMGASFLQYLSTDRAESIGLVHCFEVSAKYFLVRDSDVDVAAGQLQPLRLLLAPDSQQEMSRNNLVVDGRVNTRFGFGELFISSYIEQNNRNAWIATASIAVLLTHIFPFAFYFYIKKYVVANRQNEYDNPFAFSGLETTQIPGNDRYTELQRTIRIFGSVGVYLSLLLISFIVIFFLEDLNREQRGEYKLAGIDILDIVITLVVTIINAVFAAIAGLLTRFEKHLTYSSYRRSHTLKLYSFKILNVCAMYAAVGVVAISSACPYFDSGRKFLTLIITDLVVQNGIELLMPQITMRVLPLISSKFSGTGSDESRRPEFDLAQEYLELFYRQFIIYVGFTVFPLLPLCGLIVNLIEYPLDKFRLTKVCQRPKRVDVSLKWLLAILLMCNAIIAFALPPLGTIWILVGRVWPYEAHPGVCPVFGEPVIDDRDRSSAVQPAYEPICRSINQEFNSRFSLTSNSTCTFLADFDNLDDNCSTLVSQLYDRITALPIDLSNSTTNVTTNATCGQMITKCIFPFENTTVGGRVLPRFVP
jgi:hypothetical protein